MKKLLLFSLFALLASAMGWAATETWTKVTSTPDSWDGDYLIVYEDGNIAFNSALTTLDAVNNGTSVTINDGTITTNNCDFYFTIADKGTIKSPSGQYIGRTKSTNGLDAQETELTNTLSIESGNFVVKGSGGAYLRYNKGSNDKRFRYFKSSTYTQQQPIALYKKQEAPATKVADVTVSPAFGDIAKGTQVTISCATEGAVLDGYVGETDVKGKGFPYTFTANEVGKIEVGVWATKDGFEDSNILSGTYNVCQPKVAALEIKPGFGTIEVGTEITISCATEGAVLSGYITKDGEDTYVKDAQLPYTYTADKEGTISFYFTATKEGYDESKALNGEFIVKAAVPVAYRDVITAEDYTGTSSYTELSLEKTGAKYSSKAYLYKNKENICLQFNNNDKQAGIVMKESKAFVSKIIITWNISGKGAGFEIYGKNSPYQVAADLYDSTKTGTLIESCAWTKNGDVTEIDLSGKPFTFIGVKPTGTTYINSIEFIWSKSEAGSADVIYTKASEAKAGNFAVLATADGKAVGRNADLNPVAVTVSGDAIGLLKGQADIDEFEIKENGNNYQLYGGLASNNSRRFLTYDGTGVTTVAEADANADVTFESTAAGLLVKFNDGEYLMFNGTKFIKADYGEAVVQAEGETLTPVIVFMSSSNVSTGVETVEFDENAELQYFNLNGVQVKAENLTPGLYIVRQGNKVSKQVIR